MFLFAEKRGITSKFPPQFILQELWMRARPSTLMTFLTHKLHKIISVVHLSSETNYAAASWDLIAAKKLNETTTKK